jgi:hypothetical protein
MFAPVASETRRPLRASSRAGSGRSPVLAGGDEQGAHLIAVQPDGVRLVVEARPAHVHRWGEGQQPFFFGVAVEARDRAQSAGNSLAGAASFFQGPRIALDVASAGREQGQMAIDAPGDEQARA